MCECCGRRETVSHYLIDCQMRTTKNSNSIIRYVNIRQTLRRNLRKDAMFFRNPSNFTANNILFPHVWQQRPIYNDPKYKEKIQRNLQMRVQILKHVVQFVTETKRFKQQSGLEWF